MYEIRCPLWLPIELAQHLAAKAKKSVPVPMFTWFCWHCANARTIADSRMAMDPFPSEVGT